jgi:EpsI family protein
MCRYLLYIPFLTPFFLLYKETFSRLFNGWFTYEESHGLLIMGISLYMIWKKRSELKKLTAKPEIFKGASLLILGCFVLVAGKLSYTHIIQDISLVFNILGLVLLFGGAAIFKTLFIPLSYLIFMFPVFSEIFGNFSIHLQQITALIAANILKFLGMPVLLSAQYIELPHIVLEVAQACNGINHIMALVALSIPLALLTHQALAKRLLLVLIAFIIGIFANGLRVTLIGLWTAYKRSGPLHGPHDIFYVTFIFFFGMGLLFIINQFLRRPGSKNGKISNVAKTGEGLNFYSQPNKLKFFPSLLAFLIFISSLSYLYSFQPVPVYLKRPLKDFPLAINEWHGQDNQSVSNWLKIKADEELNRIYQNHSKDMIELYIRYFSFQNKGRSVTDYRFNLPEYQRNALQVPIGNEFLKVNKVLVPKRSSQKVIYFWYEINGETINHHYKVKLATFLEALFSRQNNGAFIMVVSDIGENNSFSEENNLKFIQSLLPIIKKSLAF